MIEIYLSALSGTGTVERFNHEKKMLSSRRADLHIRGLESSLKLLVQDVGGRRRDKLDAEKLLIKEAPSRATAGGALIVHPASQYFLKAQKKYAVYFGEKPGVASRSMELSSPSKLAKQRIKSLKPRLMPDQKTKASDKSELARLAQHAEGVKAAVARVKQGGICDTEVGRIELPSAGQREKTGLSAMAEEAWDLRKRRRAGGKPEAGSTKFQDPSDHVFFGQNPATGAASSSSLPATQRGLDNLLSHESSNLRPNPQSTQTPSSAAAPGKSASKRKAQEGAPGRDEEPAVKKQAGQQEVQGLQFNYTDGVWLRSG